MTNTNAGVTLGDPVRGSPKEGCAQGLSRSPDPCIEVSEANLRAQYDFMHDSFARCGTQGRHFLTFEFLSKLNALVVSDVSPYPGISRQDIGGVSNIVGSDHVPPDAPDVDFWVDQFFETLKTLTESRSPVTCAAYALWRIAWIHPFLQGNGRTARAYCYYTLCHGYQKWLPGTPVYALIFENRDELCALLNQADGDVNAQHMTDLTALEAFVERLLVQQLSNAVSNQENTIPR